MKRELKRIHKLPAQERYTAFTEYAHKVKDKSFKAVLKKCDQWGYSTNHISMGKRLNIDPTVVKRSVEDEVTSKLYVSNCADIAYNFLHISANEFYFEDPSVVILPCKLACMARLLKGTTKENINKITQEIDEMISKGKVAETFNIVDEPWVIVNDRLHEMAIDKGVRITQLCNIDAYTGKNFQQVLRKAQRYYQIGPENSDESFVLDIHSVAFAAFELNQSLDYFVTQDYTRFSELGYYTYKEGAKDHPYYPNQELVLVDSWETRDIIRKYLMLKKELQEEVHRIVFKYCIGTLTYPEEDKKNAFDL